MLFITACTTEEEDAESQKRQGFFIPVKVGKVVYQDARDRLRVVGNIRSDQRLTLSAEVAGPIIEIPAKDGMPVREDQLLARIDPEPYQLEVERLENEVTSARLELEKAKSGLRKEDKARLEAQLKAAQSSLNLAQKSFQDQTALYKENIISKSSWEISEDQLKKAGEDVKAATAALAAGQVSRQEDVAQLEAQLDKKFSEFEIAQLNLSRTEIRSPFQGVVISKKMDVGSYVKEGDDVVQMIGTSLLTAVLNLPQHYGNRIKDLESVQIHIKDSGIEFQLDKDLKRWVRMVPFADKFSGSLYVIVGLNDPDPRITAGQTLEADLYFKKRKNVLYVPSIALSITEMGSVVYIVKEGKAHLVPVKAGKEEDGLVEIVDFTHQLNPKVELILQGSGAVFPGASVMAVSPRPGS